MPATGNKVTLSLEPGGNAHIICSLLCQGHLLIDICKSKKYRAKGVPAQSSTVANWNARGMLPGAKEPYKTFHEMFARARLGQADAQFEQTFVIAREATPQTVHVARLQVDTLKWGLSKLHPSKYGDRSELHLSGKVEVAKPKDHAPEWMQGTLLPAVHDNPKGKSVH